MPASSTDLNRPSAHEQVGFCAEGIARGSAFFGGVFRDELIMALLRPEWKAELASGAAESVKDIEP